MATMIIRFLSAPNAQMDAPPANPSQIVIPANNNTISAIPTVYPAHPTARSVLMAIPVIPVTPSFP